MSRYRHEYKYMIDAGQEAILLCKTEGIMQKDPYANEDGTYLVRSLYFDDIHDTCLNENISGSDPRSKFRIRYYNYNTDRIVLEKKAKTRGMCLKESCKITKEECEIFLKGEVPEISDSDSPKKKELFTELRLRGLYPKVIVTYERIPFVYTGGNVRITFDRNITSGNQIDRFLEGDYAVRPILPLGQSILEVKWDEVMPRHIKEVLQLENLEWTAFSKYFMCRKMHL